MTRIQLRRGNAAAWTSANPTLSEGEVGVELDTGLFKVGDGSTGWTSLDYATDWSLVQGKPAVIAAGADAAAARSAISAASLDGNGKVPGSELPNSIMTYEGLHDVDTNDPTLSDATGSAGEVYRISVGGSRDYGSGSISLGVGDYLIHSGTVWQKADTTDAVSSVAGRTGEVTLTVADVGGDTSTALGVGSVELGHASDTTLSRSAAGVLAVEGVVVPTVSSTSTLTNKTLTNPTVNNYTEGVVAIGTVSASHTLALTNGTVQTATLTASTECTFTMPTATAGKSFVLLLKQAAATGNGTAVFTGVKWAGSAPTVTADAGAMDIVSFFADGTNWYGAITQGYTP